MLHARLHSHSGRWSRADRGITLLLVLRAFSSGATAMTGIEAISNAVPAFQPPAARNARPSSR